MERGEGLGGPMSGMQIVVQRGTRAGDRMVWRALSEPDLRRDRPALEAFGSTQRMFRVLGDHVPEGLANARDGALVRLRRGRANGANAYGRPDGTIMIDTVPGSHHQLARHPDVVVHEWGHALLPVRVFDARYGDMVWRGSPLEETAADLAAIAIGRLGGQSRSARDQWRMRLPPWAPSTRAVDLADPPLPHIDDVRAAVRERLLPGHREDGMRPEDDPVLRYQLGGPAARAVSAAGDRIGPEIDALSVRALFRHHRERSQDLGNAGADRVDRYTRALQQVASSYDDAAVTHGRRSFARGELRRAFADAGIEP